MKKLILLGLTIVTVASCTKKLQNEQNKTLTNIELSANVTNIKLKAPIGNAGGEQPTFIATVLGWEAEEGASVNYTATPTWQSTTNPLNATGDSEIILEPQQSYRNKNTSFLRAIYPGGNVQNGVLTLDGVTDGTQDILVSSVVSGSIETKISEPLAFLHPLSQVKFITTVTPGFPQSTLKSVTLKGVSLASGVNLTDGNLLYSTPSDLAIPGINNNPLSATETSVGAAVMIKPLASNVLSLHIESTIDATGHTTQYDVNATIDDAQFVAGRAYTITLTFVAANTVNVNAVVTPWTEQTGSSDVD